MTKLSIICAISLNNAIGKNNKLLFDIPEDLEHFKNITEGHPVIMGLNTYNSIGRPLPKRTNIILSKEKMEIENCLVFTSLDEAITKAKELDSEEVFVIGGGSIYAQTINLADKLYLTIVNEIVEDADTYFPDYSEFKNITKEEHFENDNYKYKFVEFTK
ncbi:MAG: dihydrofolate reductase [Patescibacteria group bacterium]|nr:dihydrofolate reductase [Patescibacteria group bacterium]MDD4304466.1 dihydrofolate reductase [Patescibacteria group bacterium]MDD4694826.1 dihydrofolate reductase [Patescibacteria group bacterium]